jgi:hypothetical protein
MPTVNAVSRFRAADINGDGKLDLARYVLRQLARTGGDGGLRRHHDAQRHGDDGHAIERDEIVSRFD